MESINLLQSFGDQMIEHLWLPVVIWTLVAAPIALLLHKSESLQPIYHYHSRTALLLVLPLGVLGAYLVDFINSATQATGEGIFIVIQNPITVSQTTAEPSVLSGLSNPNFWIGAFSIIAGLIATLLVFKLIYDFVQLRNIEQDLSFSHLTSDKDLMENLPSASKKYQNTLIAYSENTNIPFTYGWLTTRIVVPADLKMQPSSLAMAVQHELIHIKNRDFLLNSFFIVIKSLFWFHPLIHNLYTTREEYREVICDSEVLANKEFSQKKYATLLFELAKRDTQQKLALSMAVNPSSLKKRIQIMSNQNSLSMNFRWSFLITFFAASLLTLTISCTDMSQDGITNNEVQQTQSQMTSADEEELPLFIINGEEYKDKDKVTRLKSKYIKHIQVLKEQEATNLYGSKAKNGALKITLNNPEKAFSDLKDEEMLVVQKSQPDPEKTDFYHTVENMPELKGGLSALQKKINYPEEASNAGEQGRVIVQFIVNEQGVVEDPEVVKGVSEALDQEAIRVVKQAQFKPGMQDGKPVKVQYSLPISYKLPDSGQGS